MKEIATLPQFISAGDVRRYTETISGRKIEEDLGVRFWRSAKRVTLLLVLAASFLIYYLLTAMDHIVTLGHIEFLPVAHVSKGAAFPH